MTPERLETLRQWANHPHVKPWIGELIQEIDAQAERIADLDSCYGMAVEECASQAERIKELEGELTNMKALLSSAPLGGKEEE